MYGLSSGLQSERWLQYRTVLKSVLTGPGEAVGDIETDKLLELGATERWLGFNWELALKNLNIELETFNLPYEYGAHGYSSGRVVRVTRATKYPTGVLWHELAHVLLGHTDGTEPVSREVGECEAELTAYILKHVYNYNEAKAQSRTYVQGWAKTGVLKDIRVKEIYEAVDAIRRAG